MVDLIITLRFRLVQVVVIRLPRERQGEVMEREGGGREREREGERERRGREREGGFVYYTQAV